MKCSNLKPETIGLGITDRCCVGSNMCEWDGTLRNVRTEPIFVQKVFDATLVHLQALSTVNNVSFSPNLGRNASIVKVLDVRCKKYFNPNNVSDSKNLIVQPETTLSGGQFVMDRGRSGDGSKGGSVGTPIEVVGPDGMYSEKIIYVDTAECDEEGKGTPVFGTQETTVSGSVRVELDVVVQTSTSRRRTVTLKAIVPITPTTLTNFFELCVPSVYDGAFLPRFAEFCNILCETRLATNNIARDLRICPETGRVRGDLIIAVCIACEKKVIVPVQLCVLSTGYVQVSPIVSPVCTTFPSLFPSQIDEDSIDSNRPCPRPRQSTDTEDDFQDRGQIRRKYDVQQG